MRGAGRGVAESFGLLDFLRHNCTVQAKLATGDKFLANIAALLSGSTFIANLVGQVSGLRIGC